MTSAVEYPRSRTRAPTRNNQGLGSNLSHSQNKKAENAETKIVVPPATLDATTSVGFLTQSPKLMERKTKALGNSKVSERDSSQARLISPKNMLKEHIACNHIPTPAKLTSRIRSTAAIPESKKLAAGPARVTCGLTGADLPETSPKIGAKQHGLTCGDRPSREYIFATKP